VKLRELSGRRGDSCPKPVEIPALRPRRTRSLKALFGIAPCSRAWATVEIGRVAGEAHPAEQQNAARSADPIIRVLEFAFVLP